MALELVGGAVLGVLFGELQKEICRVKENFEMFKPKLEELEETLTILYPVIEEIEELNRRLHRPNHGTKTSILRKLLEDGTKLVSKCSKIPRWNILKQGRYREKLVELDNKILRFHNLYLLAHMGRDQKQTLLFVQETRQMMIMSLNQLGFSNLTTGFTNPLDLPTASCPEISYYDSSHLTGACYTDLTSACCPEFLYDDSSHLTSACCTDLTSACCTEFPTYCTEFPTMSRSNFGASNTRRSSCFLIDLVEVNVADSSKCSKIPRWNFLKQGRYREKQVDNGGIRLCPTRVELDEKIVRFDNLDLQTLPFVQEPRQKMTMSLNQQVFSNLTMGFADSSHLTTASSTGSSTISLSSNRSFCFVLDVLEQKIVIEVEVSDAERRRMSACTSGAEWLAILNRRFGIAEILNLGFSQLRLPAMWKKMLGDATISLQERVIPNEGGDGHGGGADGGSDKEEEMSPCCPLQL